MKTKVVLGIVLGALFLIVASQVTLAFLVARPALQKAAQARGRIAVLRQTKDVSVALVLAARKTGRFPTSLAGIDLGGLPLQLNPKLAGVEFETIKAPDKTIMVFEGAPGAPLYRHDGRATLGFADGHAAMTEQRTFTYRKLRWEP